MGKCHVKKKNSIKIKFMQWVREGRSRRIICNHIIFQKNPFRTRGLAVLKFEMSRQNNNSSKVCFAEHVCFPQKLIFSAFWSDTRIFGGTNPRSTAEWKQRYNTFVLFFGEL